MNRILILIALLNLSASQMAVGQEDGELGFECVKPFDETAVAYFFKVSMVDETGQWFSLSDEMWQSPTNMEVSRTHIHIYQQDRNRSFFRLNRTTLIGGYGYTSDPQFECTMMSWDEVDKKTAAYLAELNKNRAF